MSRPALSDELSIIAVGVDTADHEPFYIRNKIKSWFLLSLVHVSRACRTGHMHERRSERPPRTAPAACWADARPKDSSRQALSKPNFLARPRRSCGTWLTGSRRRAGHISLVAQPCPVLPIRTPKIAFSMFGDQACEISHFRISQRREALV